MYHRRGLTESTVNLQPRPISLSTNAIEQFKRLKKNDMDPLFVRIGTKRGGCSGMVYVMDVVDKSTITDNDEVIAFDDIHCVVETKSLLYLFGLNLDYSHALIGGGFKFDNPVATKEW